MNPNQAYFNAAQEWANEDFNGMDAFEDFTDDFSDGHYNNVNGAVKPAKTSQPYIVTVQNNNAVATPAIIFDAYVNRTAANFGNVAGITLTSGFGNVPYGALLAQSENKSFEVGIIYIESTNTAQVTQTIAVTHTDANANEASKTIVPKIDPNQQQTGVLEWYYKFPIDGYTALTINILPQTIVTYTFYPAETIDLSRGLRDNNLVRGYAGPKIGKPVNMNLSRQAVDALASAGV